MFDFQTMFNSSQAVIMRPSVATFEEHEKNDLQAATIYVAIAAAINGVLTGIGAAMGRTPGTSFIGALIGGVIFTLIFFYIYMGIVYGLGRAFGGTGNFGELAYDISLFVAPLSVVSSLLGLIPVLGGIVGLLVSLYSIYLTYLGIQSGMNLPKDKAIIVMVIIFLIGVAIVACFALVIGAFIAAMMNGTNR
jgi:Yip1-like protein